MCGELRGLHDRLKATTVYVTHDQIEAMTLAHRVALIDKGVLPKTLETPLYTTYLASTFRSIRFGLNESHGQAVALQLNYLLDQGGVIARPDGSFAVDFSKIKDGVTGLTFDIGHVRPTEHVVHVTLRPAGG